MIAPTAYHRLTFHLQQKRELVFLANRLAIAGLGFLALAMTGALMLITDVLFGGIATVVVSTGAAAMFIGLWYVLPLRRRVSLGMRPVDQLDPGPGPAAERTGDSPRSVTTPSRPPRRSIIARSSSQTPTFTSSGTVSSSATASPWVS